MLAERWDTVDGVRMHARVDPSPHGKLPLVLVLVHGLVSNRYLLPTARLLLPDFAVYGPELTGFGRTERPVEPLDGVDPQKPSAGGSRLVGIERPTLVRPRSRARGQLQLARGVGRARPRLRA